MRPVESVSPVPPSVGWVLVALKQFSCNRVTYPRNSLVPPEALGRNFQAFLNGRFVAWEPPGDRVRSKPHEIPPPEKPKPRPDRVVIIDDPDIVQSWRLTKAEVVIQCGGDAAVAMDLLMADRQTAALFKRATYEACQREAKRRKVVSVSPSDLSPRL